MHAQAPACAQLVETVLDEVTRVPLVGARVLVSARGSAPVMARTDSLGQAVMCVAPHQPLSIRSSYAEINQSWETTVESAGSRHHTTLINPPGVFVRGRIVDHASGDPIQMVAVRIVNSGLSVLTDADGRFYFERLPLGAYRMRVDRLGYASQTTQLDVGSSDLDALVRMTPVALAIQPITVTAFSQRLELVGFYDRKRRGGGTFIDRKKIDAMNVQATSDLLRSIPSLRLVPQQRGSRQNQPRNATIGGRGNCRFVYVVDGVRTLGDFDMDYVAPHALEGVEVYNGTADVPVAFKAHASSVSGSTICGVIAMWTRNSR